MKAWIYIRLEGSEHNENQLAKHKFELTEFANSLYLTTAGLSWDIGNTATLNRPGIRQLVENIDKGNVNILIVKQPAQLSSNAKSLIEFISFLKEHRIEIYTPSKGCISRNIIPVPGGSKAFLTALERIQ